MSDYLKGLMACITLAVGFVTGSILTGIAYEQALKEVDCKCQCTTDKSEQPSVEPPTSDNDVGAEPTNSK